MAGIIERTILRIKSKAPGLAACFGAIAGLSVMYGIFEGMIVADNVYSILFNQFHSVGEMIVISVVTVVAGGFFQIAGMVGKTSLTFSIILILAAIFFVWIGIWKAIETVRWQQRIESKLN